MTAETASADTSAEPTPALVEQSVALPTGKVKLSAIGMVVEEDLTFEEWVALAPHIGTAVRSMCFVVGDWLTYGEDMFSGGRDFPEIDAGPRAAKRISQGSYDEAIKATGIDLTTLKTYVHVSRRVPRLLRNNLLSWEHHKAVAKLKGPDQSRWLAMAERGDDHGQLSARRLRASINAGRVLSPDELSVPPSEQGVSNHIPSINRLAAWWKQAGGNSWLSTRSPEQIEALLRDFEPVIQILAHLRDRLARMPKQQHLLP